jgi:hypothetical protein
VFGDVVGAACFGMGERCRGSGFGALKVGA